MVGDRSLRQTGTHTYIGSMGAAAHAHCSAKWHACAAACGKLLGASILSAPAVLQPTEQAFAMLPPWHTIRLRTLGWRTQPWCGPPESSSVWHGR